MRLAGIHSVGFGVRMVGSADSAAAEPERTDGMTDEMGEVRVAAIRRAAQCGSHLLTLKRIPPPDPVVTELRPTSLRMKS
jgi:hypothetical protein